MSKGLRHHLLETCTLTGERFPEYDEWLATEKAEKAEHWRRVKELEGNPAGLVLFALEKLTGKKPPAVPKAKLASSAFATLGSVNRPLPPTAKPQVGRNDPCPCRSGKKFKQCCMKKQNDY
ncbi:MAG: SEC-C domain-containing protein [Planctomycetes bacterium]|nr:SEC-C domain-containing protein [Planctomycetota bacterium]